MDQSPAARALQASLELVRHQRALLSAATFGNTEIVKTYLDMGFPVTTKDDEGFSLLHRAAWGGHVTTMRLLIKRECDVDSIDASGRTPLHLAARNGQTRAVRELIRHGASKSVVCGEFGTPLQQAALRGHVETVVAMLEKGCPIDAVDNDGLAVLFWAAKGGHVEVIKVLVDRGCDVNAASPKSWIPLHVAAAYGKTEAVCELIKLGSTKSVSAGIFGTPLHQAATHGQVETAVAMLEEGCPIDAVSSDGATVLHFAASGGDVELVKELEGRGCDVNAVDAHGCTPLHIAAGDGRVEAVHELIKLHATKSVIAGTSGTPLHQAACNGHMGTVVALLEEGCTIGEVNSAGDTALHFAAENGHVEVVRELVARGSDVNAVDTYGSSSLHVAAFCDSLSLESDFVNSTNCNGVTPLMIAFGGGHVGICRLLVAGGAIISVKDKFGWLAFEHCFVGGHSRKLSQFCEACGIRNNGEGLRDALATLITIGLVDAHKVLCLCAISGDSVFLGDQFIDMLKTNCCTLPKIVKYAKAHFTNRLIFLDELHLPVDGALNPLHICLLSLKLFEMGLTPYRSDAQDSTAHISFITKLLSHPVLRATVHENLPNGLSPLDLAQQSELHEIAAQIEKAGGHPGVWVDVPQEIEANQPLALLQLKEAYSSIKAIAEAGEHGHQLIKRVFTSVLQQPLCERPPLCNAEQPDCDGILRHKPKLSKLTSIILSKVSTQNWKLVGLLLLDNITDGEEKLKSISHQFSDDRNRFLETLSYWLEHGSSVTWKTLLEVLGHYETKHTIDELTHKIVSELGGANEVSI